MLVKYYEDSIKERDANREKFWKVAMLIQKLCIHILIQKRIIYWAFIF